MEDSPVARRGADSEIPFGIKLVALWQFAKAAGLALIFSGLWTLHEASPVAGVADAVTLSNNPAFVFAAVIVLYPVVVGVGVWNLQRWARWLLLPAFALTAPWWAMQWLPDASYFDLLRALLPRSFVPLVATLDLLAILVLLLPDSRKAFGDAEDDVVDPRLPWE